MATLAPTPNFWGILYESKRIIKAHSRHFLALTVLFLLPLSFSILIYPTFQTTLSQSQSKHILFLLSYITPTSSDYSLQTLALPLIFVLFVSLFSLCAIGTITYSTYHGFYGRPVKLASSIKSLFHSFIPLAITTIVFEIVVVLIFALFGIFAVLAVKGFEILGFVVDYNSNYFLGFCIVIVMIFVLVCVRLQVNWLLACVIVVVESKWGLEPLRRSSYLTKGMRPVSLSLTLFFAAAIGFFLWGCSGTFSGSFSDVWKCLSFVLQTVLGSSIIAMFMLQKLASTTVLYMYCKALRGELAGEIAEEFACEYVSLPFDDAKVPHVVFVVQT
ncbi:hypothetical protein CsSME_00022217 [Camellia sinensis var. sinensis]|uniref:Uncharacterized protein n=1 Tax=Camellia sinensis var. sinensis TaxID=542762 RepID=A0A4S4DEW1_CAMSN|nr:uncharacterized protein LOC114295548 [Camellia sinensis]THG01239.1 hypothetical protein TEA_026240 [Camellia sinensis var. sinensis]